MTPRQQHGARPARGTTIAAAAILLLAPPARAAPPTVPDDVQRAARQRVDYGYTPSIAIGVVNADGRSTWTHGTRSWQDPTPTDEHTVYEIASVTKTFTALLLAQMHQAGDVASSDTVASLLPPETPLPGNGGDSITLLHLATHRSGLPTLTPPPSCTFFDLANPFASYSTATFDAFLASFQLPRRPGRSYEYSNLGFGLLGNTLAHSQHTSYESLLRSRVLDPLGMHDTSLTRNPSQESRRAPGHAGYVERPPFLMAELAPAGGLFSTVDDLLTYLAHNLGLVPGSPLLDAMQETHRPRGSQPSVGGVQMQGGLAWFLWDLGDGVVQHGGDSIGSAAFVGFRPSTGTGAVVLSNNRRHDNADVRDLGMRCLDAINNLNPTTRPASVPLADKLNLTGRYRIGEDEIVVGLVRDELTLISNHNEATLYPLAPTRFSLPDATGGADFRFRLGTDTRGATLSVLQFGERFDFDRVTAPPHLRINRDCEDIVIRLFATAAEQFQLQRSDNGGPWQDIRPWSVRDPPHREPLSPLTHLFRIVPAAPQ